MGKNTQANVTYSNEVFKQYVLKLSTGLIWKNQALANASESSDVYDRYRADIFLLANQGRLVFSAIRSFPRVVLQNVFGVSDEIIDRYASDKNTIPVDDREAVVEEYQNALSSKNPQSGNYEYWDATTESWVQVYQEPNNYYRMLMGVPDLGDNTSIYLTRDQILQYVSEDDTSTIALYLVTPVQNLPTAIRYAMELDGTLDVLMKANPTKEYLKYIGRKKIDFYTSRSAERFSLLWRDSSDSETLNEAWDQNYEASRRMITSVYYSNAFRRDNTLYDNFVAMSILFVTIHQMQIVYLKADFTREFYDLESLKIVYDTYGVPFYSEIPIKYHKKVVKNINRLISGKGSDNVFFDLFDIFDMGSMELYNYFFVKKHITDEAGNPVFCIKYKDGESGGFIVDEESDSIIGFDDPNGDFIYQWYETGIPLYDANGRVLIDYNSFDWFFSKVPIGYDPAMVISDDSSYVDYEEVTGSDPYWVEDENLENAKGMTNVNFVESKYLGINTVVDMMKIVYESAYLFRMILDNNIIASTLTSFWPDVSTEISISVSILDIIIYISLLISRISGYEELISDRIPAVAESLGYNFEHLAEVISKAERNGYTSRNVAANRRIYELIDSMKFEDFQDFDNSYESIQELRDLIAERYFEATSIQEFEAYRDLYRTLMTSLEITSSYIDPNEIDAVIIDDESGLPLDSEDPNGTMISNGSNIFPDLQSMLDSYNPNLLQRYLMLTDASLATELNLALIKFQDMLSSVEYIPMATGSITGSTTTTIMSSLLKILKFFKSAKAEILDFNLIFVIRDRAQNFFRSMDRVKSTSINETYVETDIRTNIDYIDRIEAQDRASDIQILTDLNQYDVLYEYVYPGYGSYIIDDESELPFESGEDARPSLRAIEV